MLDGETEAPGGLAQAVALHLLARACPPEDAIAVGAELGLEEVVGTLWLAGGALDDPLLRLELRTARACGWPRSAVRRRSTRRW